MAPAGVAQVEPSRGRADPGPGAAGAERLAGRHLRYVALIAAGAVVTSGLSAAPVAWLFGVPLEPRILGMALTLPLIVAPAASWRFLVMAAWLRLEQAPVRQRSALLPVCAGCRQIKDDDGSWRSLEEYVAGRLQAIATHAMCPDCVERRFPEG